MWCLAFYAVLAKSCNFVVCATMKSDMSVVLEGGVKEPDPMDVVVQGHGQGKKVITPRV